jgi:hypothetical protein
VDPSGCSGSNRSTTRRLGVLPTREDKEMDEIDKGQTSIFWKDKIKNEINANLHPSFGSAIQHIIITLKSPNPPLRAPRYCNSR